MTRLVHVDYTVLKYFCSLSVYVVVKSEDCTKVRNLNFVQPSGQIETWTELILSYRF